MIPGSRACMRPIYERLNRGKADHLLCGVSGRRRLRRGDQGHRKRRNRRCVDGWGKWGFVAFAPLGVAKSPPTETTRQNRGG